MDAAPIPRPDGLTNREILRIVNRYIGVSHGYLGDFSYRTHTEFYPGHCDLDIDPFNFLEDGTTRERFIRVLESVPPDQQAKIIRGVLDKYPAGSAEFRTESTMDELVEMAVRLERTGVVAGSTLR